MNAIPVFNIDGTAKQDFARAAAQQGFVVGKYVRLLGKSGKIKAKSICKIIAVASETNDISIEFGDSQGGPRASVTLEMLEPYKWSYTEPSSAPAVKIQKVGVEEEEPSAEGDITHKVGADKTVKTKPIKIKE